MCTPSPPKPVPVVAPPPPPEQAKPLGTDDDQGPTGIASVRSAGRNGLSIRAPSTSASPGLSIGSGNRVTVSTPSRDTSL